MLLYKNVGFVIIFAMRVLTGCCEAQKAQRLTREKKNYRVGAHYYHRGGGNTALKNSGRIFMLLEEIKSSK